MVVGGAKPQDFLCHDGTAVRTGIKLDGPSLEPALPDRIWSRLCGVVETLPIFRACTEPMAHFGHSDQVTPLEIEAFDGFERDDSQRSFLGARGCRCEFKFQHIQSAPETSWNLEAVLLTDLALG